MKHIEDTPWWICDPDDTNYVAYSDTDSIYIHAEPLLKLEKRRGTKKQMTLADFAKRVLVFLNVLYSKENVGAHHEGILIQYVIEKI